MFLILIECNKGVLFFVKKNYLWGFTLTIDIGNFDIALKLRGRRTGLKYAGLGRVLSLPFALFHDATDLFIADFRIVKQTYIMYFLNLVFNL